MTAPIVEFKDVTCRYETNTVLDRINLHLHRGQFAGVVGPSGAGKTTLLKTVLGIVKPAKGMVKIGGEPLNGRPSRRVAYVPQVESVDWNFPVTVEQAVMMGRTTQMRIWPWPSKADHELAGDLMERLGIAEFRNRHIRELSGGQQQRVFLARALIAQPDLLVLDEPTAGVDLRTQEDILHLLADLNRGGMTILMTTHDLNSAAAHLPWLICLNHTVIAQGLPQDVFIPDILNATYCGDMVVVHKDGMIFVQERPHSHTWADIIENPVLTHPYDENQDAPLAETDEKEEPVGQTIGAL